ncbi:hypothetical protein C1645_842052, partial [Glomus cerebriforme]
SNPNSNGSPNSNSIETKPLDNNWKNEVTKVLNGNAAALNEFQDIINSWENSIKKNQQVQNGELPATEAEEGIHFESKAEFPFTLTKKALNLNKNAEDTIIQKFENKYNLKLRKFRKIGSLAKFLVRLIVDNIQADNPFSRSGKHGFSSNSPAVVEKATELKNLLASYQVEIDLNKCQEIVAQG